MNQKDQEYLAYRSASAYAQKLAWEEVLRIGKPIDDGYGRTWYPADVPTWKPNYGQRCK